MPAWVTATTVGNVHVLRIDDGNVNALSPRLMDELGDAITAAPENAALVLAGRPGCFCAGLDRTSMLSGDRTAISRNLRRVTELYEQVLAHPGPTVAACTGHALAAGALLLLVADLRIGVRARARIGFNEVGIGLPLAPLAVAAARARLDGRALVRATVHAEVYDADGALAVGFLDDLVEPDADPTVSGPLATDDVEKVVEAAIVRAEPLAALDRPAYLTTRDLVWNAVRDEVDAARERRRTNRAGSGQGRSDR